MEQLGEALVRAFIPPATGWLVVAIIVGLSGWTAWSLWREFARLKLEQGEVLEAAKRKLSESETLGDACESLHQWAFHSELKDTLTARAVRAVLAMREARHPDLEAILTMMDYSEASRLNLARSAPNWLLLIGIGGTVIGLASAVVPLAPQIQAAVGALEPTAASASMAKALEAMQHAFACSLWGITAAILVSVATRKIMSQQQQVIASIQEFVLSDLAWRLLPKSEAVQIEEVQRTLEAGRRFLTNITKEIERTSSMMQVAADNFNAVLSDTVQRMEGIGANLHASAEQIQQTLKEATRSVESSATKLHESANSLIQSSEQLRQHHTSLERAHTKLQELYDRSTGNLKEIIKNQIDQIEQYRKEIERIERGMLERLAGISTNLRDTQVKFSESTEKVVGATREVKESIKATFDSFSGTLVSILEQYEEVSHQAERALREIVGVLNDLRSGSPAKVAVQSTPTTQPVSAGTTTPISIITENKTANTPFSSESSQGTGGFTEQDKRFPPSGQGVVSINHPELSEKQGFLKAIGVLFHKIFRR